MLRVLTKVAASTALVNPEHLSSSALPWGVGWASASPGEGQQGKGQPPEQTVARGAEHACENSFWVQWAEMG